MKIDLDWSGAKPAKLDFALLRASLAAAQASTPTAAASGLARPVVEPTEALAHLFGEAAGPAGAGLHGSFNPAQATAPETDE